LREDILADRAGWVLIENEGALFRGPSRGLPEEIWVPCAGWKPYAGRSRDRGVEWGTEITIEEAEARMKAKLAARPGSANALGRL
jgi:hypothetical protein